MLSPMLFLNIACKISRNMNINKCENCFGATLRSIPLALEYEEKTDELFMVFFKNMWGMVHLWDVIEAK